MLEPYVTRIGGTRLWELYSSNAPLHARQNALRLMFALPKWEAIGYLLKATLVDEASLAERAREHVVRWNSQYNRAHAVPTKTELSLARAALLQARERLPGSTVAALSFSLRTFGSEG